MTTKYCTLLPKLDVSKSKKSKNMTLLQYVVSYTSSKKKKKISLNPLTICNLIHRPKIEVS